MIDFQGLAFDTLPSVAAEAYRTLPNVSAIYFALDAQDRVLYVGQTDNLQRRWYYGHHVLTPLQQQGFVRLCWLSTSLEDLNTVEAAAITYFMPRLNSRIGPARQRPEINGEEELDGARQPIMIRFDRPLLRRIDAAAKQRGIARSAMVHFLCDGMLKHLERD